MKEKIVDSMSELGVTPSNFITLMFERTDEEGTLYIPGWHYDRPGWMHGANGSTDENDSYRCRVDWNLEKYEKLLKKFNCHFENLKTIAGFWDKIDDTTSKAKNLLDNLGMFEVWSTYVKPFSVSGIDYEKVADIEDRMETVEWVKSIAKNIAQGNSIEDFEKQAIFEYLDISVSDEEIKYRQNYLDAIFKESEARVGKNICAYDVVIRSRRLCRLFSLKAPQSVIYNEARQLAAAFLLHEYGISRETVDNYFRMRLEREEFMTEEELDELSRPKKSNSRKSLAPLFVHQILKEKSSSKQHLRQQDILNELEKYPYEITLERKALSRLIHNLIDSPNLAVFQDKSGVWIDQENKA